MSRIDGTTIASNRAKLGRGARMAEYAEQAREHEHDDQEPPPESRALIVVALVILVVALAGLFV